MRNFPSTPGSTNIAEKSTMNESMHLLLKVVGFLHFYVSLPEGTDFGGEQT